MHYILSPKPWDEFCAGEVGEKSQDASHVWWFEVNRERLVDEEGKGIKDGF